MFEMAPCNLPDSLYTQSVGILFHVIYKQFI